MSLNLKYSYSILIIFHVLSTSSNNNNKNDHNTSSHSPPGPFGYFPSWSNLKNMKSLNNRVKSTHSILLAFWWENREGSASLPMWRSYILNQIHVCFVWVCVPLLFSTSSGYRLASVALQHTQYLPFSFVTGLRCYCVWSLPHCKK